jgi:hypothetical protein
MIALGVRFRRSTDTRARAEMAPKVKRERGLVVDERAALSVLQEGRMADG